MGYEISSKSEIDKFGNLYFLVTFKEDGKILEKRMEPIKFAEILVGSIKKDVKMIEFPSVIPECIKKARMGSDGNKGTFEAVMVFPAQKRGFSFAEKIFYIPFPALVMKVVYVNGLKKADAVFALDTDEPEANSSLYNYPFGNVYADGHICFGNIKVDVSCLEEAPRVFEDFICGKTNGDLYYQNVRGKSGKSQGEFVEYLSGLDEFPKEELVKCKLEGKKYFGEL